MTRARYAAAWIAAVCLACGNSRSDDGSTNVGGSSGASATGGNGGTATGGGSAGTAGATGTPAACEAMCVLYGEQCAMSTSDCDSTCAYAVYDVPECDAPYWRFYECLAARPTLEFDCASPFALQDDDACESDRAEYIGCSLTMGEDCRPDPTVNGNCAQNPENPPNFVYCRPDATPPPGCVLFATSRLQGVVTYCCN